MTRLGSLDVIERAIRERERAEQIRLGARNRGVRDSSTVDSQGYSLNYPGMLSDSQVEESVASAASADAARQSEKNDVSWWNRFLQGSAAAIGGMPAPSTDAEIDAEAEAEMQDRELRRAIEGSTFGQEALLESRAETQAREAALQGRSYPWFVDPVGHVLQGVSESVTGAWNNTAPGSLQVPVPDFAEPTPLDRIEAMIRTREQMEAEQEAAGIAAEAVRQRYPDSNGLVREVTEGLRGGAVDLLTPALRFAGASPAANTLRAGDEGRGQAVAEMRESDQFPLLSEIAGGTTRSLVPMVAAAPTGLAGITALYGTQAYDQGLREADLAGLTGADRQAFAGAEAVVEAGVMQAFNRLGLGGVETQLAAKQAATTGLRSALARAGVSSLQEIPEEVLTESLHAGVRSSFPGVDPDALDLDRLAPQLGMAAAQAVAMAGVVGAPEIVRGARESAASLLSPSRADAVDPVEAFIREPSRRAYQALPPEIRDQLPRENRGADGRRQFAEQLRTMRTSADSAMPPVDNTGDPALAGLQPGVPAAAEVVTPPPAPAEASPLMPVVPGSQETAESLAEKQRVLDELATNVVDPSAVNMPGVTSPPGPSAGGSGLPNGTPGVSPDVPFAPRGEVIPGVKEEGSEGLRQVTRPETQGGVVLDAPVVANDSPAAPDVRQSLFEALQQQLVSMEGEIRKKFAGLPPDVQDDLTQATNVSVLSVLSRGGEMDPEGFRNYVLTTATNKRNDEESRRIRQPSQIPVDDAGAEIPLSDSRASDPAIVAEQRDLLQGQSIPEPAFDPDERVVITVPSGELAGRVERVLDDGRVVVRTDRGKPAVRTVSAGSVRRETPAGSGSAVEAGNVAGGRGQLPETPGSGSIQPQPTGVSPVVSGASGMVETQRPPSGSQPGDVAVGKVDEQGRRTIGINRDGFTLQEDSRGVRSYVDDRGYRQTEPVGMRPTRAGVEVSVDRRYRPDYKTQDEIAAEQSSAPDGDETGLASMGARMAQGMRNGLIDSIWQRVQAGKSASPHAKKPPFEQVIDHLAAQGLIRDRSDIEELYSSADRVRDPAGAMAVIGEFKQKRQSTVDTRSAVVDTILGPIDMTEFEKNEHTPEQVTKQDWINLQRAERRRLGQPEESGTDVAPFSDYEGYHENAVKQAVARGKEVDPQVLADYPDLRTGADAATETPPAGNRQPPSFRDWRYVPQHRNSGRIVPNKVGAKFTSEERQALVSWAKSQDMQVLDVSDSGFRVVSDGDARLDLSLMGAEGVKREREAAATRERQSQEQDKAKEQSRQAASRESAPWITATFGDAMNSYNQMLLSDFLEGVAPKFKGMPSPRWREGLSRTGALTDSGEIDWKKLKAAYQSQSTTASTSPQPAAESKPRSPLPRTPRGQLVMPGLEREAAAIESRESEYRDTPVTMEVLEKIGGRDFAESHRRDLQRLPQQVRQQIAEKGMVDVDALAKELDRSRDLRLISSDQDQYDDEISNAIRDAATAALKTNPPQSVKSEGRTWSLGDRFSDETTAGLHADGDEVAITGWNLGYEGVVFPLVTNEKGEEYESLFENLKTISRKDSEPESQPAPAMDFEQFAEAMDIVSNAGAANGAPVTFGAMRKATGLSKPDFDATVLRFKEEGKLKLDLHDFKSSLTDQDRETYVVDGRGNYYTEASFTPAAREEIARKLRQPTSQSNTVDLVYSTAEEAPDLGVYRANGRYAVRDAVEHTNPKGWGDSLFDTEKEARAEVERIQLGRQRKSETDKAIADREAKDAAEKAAREDVRGFGASYSPLQRGRAIAALNKMVRYRGVEGTIKSHVERLVEEGAETSTREEPKIQPMSRTEFNRATQEEQDEHQRRMDEAGTRTVYLVGGADFGKTGYDYANYLMQQASGANAAEPKSSPQPPIKPRTPGKPLNRTQKDAALRHHFTPGKIVPSYSGQDRVIAFNQDGPESTWSVDVQAVDERGNPIEGERVRRHGTEPDAKTLLKVYDDLVASQSAAPQSAASDAAPELSDVDQAIRDALMAELAPSPDPQSAPQAGKRKRTEAKGTLPARPRKPRSGIGQKTEAAAEKSKQELKDAVKELGDIAKDLGILSGVPLEPKAVVATVKVVKAAVKAGITSFADYAVFIAENLNEQAARKLAPYLERGWAMLKTIPGYEQIDEAGSVTEVLDARMSDGQSGSGVRGPDSGGRGEGEPGIRGRNEQSADSGDAAVLERTSSEDGVSTEEAGDSEGIRSGERGGVSAGDARSGRDGNERGGRGEGSSVGTADDRGVDGGDPTAAGTGRSNYHLKDYDRILGGGKKTKFRRNQKAIQAVMDIKAENRAPTQEELDAIAGYTGWGDFGQELFQGTFDEPSPKPDWREESDWLREHLGRDRWMSAANSTVNAHYTDPGTVNFIWDAVARLGFKGGRVLEPAVGIGNFFSLMPRDLMAKSSLTGMDMDGNSAEMAEILHPNANIQTMPYQNSMTPDNFYDLVISNVPFGKLTIRDRKYSRFSPSVHNYFFLKAIDQVKPGGLVAFITSNWTMDAVTSALIRRELAKKAKLVTAIRFPSGAFQEYAGTKVVADLIILQKRAEGDVSPDPSGGWAVTQPQMFRDGNGKEQPLELNEYWSAHRENILGDTSYGSGTTNNAPGLIVTRTSDFPAQLKQAMSRLPKDIVQVSPVRDVEIRANKTDRRQSSIVIDRGRPFVVTGEHLLPLDNVVKWTVKSKAETDDRLDQIVRMAAIRDALQDVFDKQAYGSEQDASQSRKTLNRLYDEFVALHGPLTESKSLRFFQRAGDPLSHSVAQLESRNANGEYEKRPIFTRSTTRGLAVSKNMNVGDAYAVQRNESMLLDLDRIAELTGKPVDEVERLLVEQDLIYRDATGGWISREALMSGNVRLRLRQLQAAAKEGVKGLDRTIEKVRSLIPEDIQYVDIEAKLGAQWVESSDYARFIEHLLDADEGSVTVERVGNTWLVSGSDDLWSRAQATDLWGFSSRHSDGRGPKRWNLRRLVTAAMQNETLQVKWEDEDGISHLDEDETKTLNGKLDELREQFKEWLWDSPERVTRLVTNYNELMNAYVNIEFDGSHLSFQGMALERGDDPFSLRKHQINAIWRGIFSGRGLFAHEVGTGKTITMAGIALESRRLGLMKKPLILAHNANASSVARDIQATYPGAKVLMVDSLSPKTRRETLARIAMDDWDAVVMPHSMIDKLALKPETVQGILQEQIDSLMSAAVAVLEQDENGTSWGTSVGNINFDDSDSIKSIRNPTAKQMAMQRLKLMERINEARQLQDNTDAVFFEEMGIDGVLVDEAHEFKKVPIATRQKVKGLSIDSSQRAIMLSLLTQHIHNVRDGRGVYLFTGTPITNTLNEIYNMQRYIMPKEMKQLGIWEWDGWFNQFADAESDSELNAGGVWETVERLTKFVNVPELRHVIDQYLDVVFADDMPEFALRETREGMTDMPVGRPYREVVIDIAPATERQKSMIQRLKDLYNRFWDYSAKTRREMSLAGSPDVPLSIDRRGMAVAFDPRLEDLNEPVDSEDSENLKVRRAFRNIMKHFHEDPRATQMVFMETGLKDTGTRTVQLGVDADGRRIKSREQVEKFSVVAELTRALINAGVPADQIINFSELSTEKRADAAERMRRGEIRIAFGSSQSMGVGINAQTYLRALHHLDAPWRPADLEQRDGRGWRQGNKWNTVYTYRYLTERSHDARRWQVLLTKARFIVAFLKGTTDRVIEGDAVDLDDEGGSMFSETLSAAAGDPRILKKNKLDGQIKKLEAMATRHVAALRRAALAVQESRENQKRLKAEIDSSRRDMDAYNASKGKPFELTFDNVRYTDRDLADQAMAAFWNDPRATQRVGPGDVIGKYRDFSIVYDPYRRGAGLQGNAFHVSKLSVGSFDANLRNLPRHIERLEKELDAARSMETQSQGLIGRPFARQKELDTKKKQYFAIVRELDASPDPAPSWLTEGLPAGSSAYIKSQWGRPEEREVVGHRMANDKLFVLVEGDEGLEAIPLEKVFDAQGAVMFPHYQPEPEKGSPENRHATFPGPLLSMADDPATNQPSEVGTVTQGRPRGPRGAGPAASVDPGDAAIPMDDSVDASPVEIDVQRDKVMARAVPLPELVELAEMLQGEVPKMGRRLRRALGLFKPDDQIPSSEILIRPDIAKNKRTLTQVLAHEIGHLIDWLPDHTLRRGNILGRLASLRSYLKDMLDAEPTDPSLVLTPKDRRRLRAQAKSDVGPRPPADEEADLAAWKDEVSKRYQELLEDEANARGLVRRGWIMEELVDLTNWWKPYDQDQVAESYIEYRESSRELMADAMSVLLNAPAELQRRAPLFWQMFEAYLDRKPEVADAFIELWDRLSDPDAVVSRRRERIQEGRERGAAAFKAAAQARVDARLSLRDRLWKFATQGLLDSFLPAKARARRLGRRDIEYQLDELHSLNSAAFSLFRDTKEEITDVLTDAGVTDADIHEYLFANRIVTEVPAEPKLDKNGNPLPNDGKGKARFEIANPYGFDVESSREQLASLRKKLGDERFNLLEERMQHWHRDILWPHVEEAVSSGVYSQDAFDRKLEPNKDSYAAFAVVKYIDESVSPMLREQTGTFEEIGDAFQFTMLKFAGLVRLNQLNAAKVAVADQVLPQFSEIQKVAVPFGQPQPPGRPAPGMAFFSVLRDGRAHWYEVPEEIERSFKLHDVGMVAGVARAFSSHLYRWLHPLYVTFSPGFLSANPYRDLNRTWVNLGALHGTSLREVIHAWLTSLPEASRAVRGRPSDLMTRMLAEKAFDVPFHSLMAVREASTPEGVELEKGRFEEWIDDSQSYAARFLRFVRFVGETQEVATKMAGFKLLEQAGVEGSRRAFEVRKFVGTPDYKQRGLATDMTNFMFMYSKVKWNALQQDVRLATGREGGAGVAAGYWWRMMMSAVVPAILTKALVYGLLGDDDDQDWIKKIPKDIRDNYHVIPMGYADDGEIVFLTVPMDETQRFFHRLTGHLVDAFVESRGGISEKPSTETAAKAAMGEFLDLFLPSFNPGIKIGKAWAEYSAGMDPVDPYRKAPILPRYAREAGGSAAANKMIQWTWEQTGVLAQTTRFVTGQLFGSPDSLEDETIMESALQAVGGLTGLSRLLRKTRRGETEAGWVNLKREEMARQKRINEYTSPDVRKLRSELAMLQGQPVEDLTPAQQFRRQELSLWDARVYRELTEDVGRMTAAELKELGKRLDAAAKSLDGIRDQAIGKLIMDAVGPADDKAWRASRLDDRGNSARAVRILKSLNLSPAELQQQYKAEVLRAAKAREEADAAREMRRPRRISVPENYQKNFRRLMSVMK